MIKKLIGIVWLTVFLPVICFAGEINVKRLDKQNWINIATSNFNVLTDEKEPKTIEIVRELEDFKYFLAFSLGFEQKNLSEKVSVIAAKNKGTFISLGMPDNIAGVFASGAGYVIIVRCDRFKSSSQGGSSWGRSVVLHELVHLFLRNASLEFALPIWFEEGVAEYFGTYIEKKDRVIIGDMTILGNRFYSMLKVNRKFHNVDTESLFKTSKSDLKIGEERNANQELFVDRFYARSAAVVHYMYADSNRTRQLYQYLYLLGKGFSVDESFNHVFKMTFSELDEQVNKYISGRYLSGIAFRISQDGIEFPDIEYQENDITKREALGFLYKNLSLFSDKFLGEGNLEKLNNDMEELYPGLIDMEIQEQLSENPKNVGLLLKTARTYEKLNRYSEAIGLYEKVLLIDASNHGALNNLAWLLVTVPDMALRDPQRAIPLAEKAVAIERSPGYLDTLAEAFYAAGSFQMAIETINQAISLDPDDTYLKEQLKKFTAALETS